MNKVCDVFLEFTMSRITSLMNIHLKRKLVQILKFFGFLFLSFNKKSLFNIRGNYLSEVMDTCTENKPERNL